MVAATDKELEDSGPNYKLLGYEVVHTTTVGV